MATPGHDADSTQAPTRPWWDVAVAFSIAARRSVAVLSCYVVVALPVDARHGCLRFAPGSHVAGQLPHVEAPSPSNLLSRGQRVEAWDASTEVVAALRGGEASIHQLLTVHRSAPNVGDNARVGLAMRFIAAACRSSCCCCCCCRPC